AEWTYNGHHLFTIANHFNSKLGDESLYGVDQPPQRSSEVQRHKQATIVNDFVGQLETADPSVDVVVLGDLNDFQFSDTLTLLKGTELHTLIDTLPANEQYTYVFEGNSQAIDHTLLSNHAFASIPWQYDVVHLNSEFADNASDHEPQVTRLYLPPDITAPVVTPPADTFAEATSPSGALVSYGSCTATDDFTATAALVFDYSIANNSTFPLGITPVECGATDAAGNRGSATFRVHVVDTTKPAITGTATPAPNAAGWNNSPVTVHFTCSDLFLVSCSDDTILTADGAGQSVTGTAMDSSNNTASVTIGGINIDRTAPTVSYTGNAGTYTVDQTISITCSASDALSGLATNTCANISGPAYAFLGTNTYHATASDVAGNSTTATATFTVGATSDSLCALAKQLVTNTGVAGALCQKLSAAADAELRGDQGVANNIIDAFKHQVDAQTGKTISAAAADLLKRLAGAL
ncbi:MAG TPA: HYR domain-containing protein, partial [Candidatus Limnocylindria bacterium]